MTDQTPPPPPPPSDPTPGGAANFDLNRFQSDLKSAGPFKLTLAAIGVLTLIWSFLPYYTVSLSGYAGISGPSGSGSAWHGFFGWAGAILALAAGVISVLPALKVSVSAPPVTVVALFGVGFVFTLLALFIWPGKVNLPGVDYGHGIGYWLALLFTLAGTVLSGYRYTQERQA